jgi:molybdopterin/thiamine biosynthesis adenylyltransferase
MALTAKQRKRYARNLVLPGWGEAAQVKLAEAHVLVVGAGGLGSPCLFHLAAVGVGKLTLVEGDVVDPSNLQRQILHAAADIGRAKVESAGERLLALRPDLLLTTVPERLSAANALDLFAGCDIAIDASDTYETRFLCSDAAVLSGTPLVHGSVFRYEGQITTILPGEGPCLRCIYPAPPAPGIMPSGAEAGVLGVAPGVVGTLQAAEAIKYITGLGDLLVGRLLVYDSLSATFDELCVARCPTCPACGECPSIRGLG